MWWYENVTRVDFEAVKDTIEQIMFRLGASKYEIRSPYRLKQQTIQTILKKRIILYDQYLHIKDYFSEWMKSFLDKSPLL